MSFKKPYEFNRNKSKCKLRDLQVCRGCLATNVRLYDMHKNQLMEAYSRLIQIKDDLPNYLCSCCATLLLKFDQFRGRCSQARLMLENILNENVQLTKKHFKDINRKSKKFMLPYKYTQQLSVNIAVNKKQIDLNIPIYDLDECSNESGETVLNKPDVQIDSSLPEDISNFNAIQFHITDLLNEDQSVPVKTIAVIDEESVIGPVIEDNDAFLITDVSNEDESVTTNKPTAVIDNESVIGYVIEDNDTFHITDVSDEDESMTTIKTTAVIDNESVIGSVIEDNDGFDITDVSNEDESMTINKPTAVIDNESVIGPVIEDNDGFDITDVSNEDENMTAIKTKAVCDKESVIVPVTKDNIEFHITYVSMNEDQSMTAIKTRAVCDKESVIGPVIKDNDVSYIINVLNKDYSVTTIKKSVVFDKRSVDGPVIEDNDAFHITDVSDKDESVTTNKPTADIDKQSFVGPTAIEDNDVIDIDNIESIHDSKKTDSTVQSNKIDDSNKKSEPNIISEKIRPAVNENRIRCKSPSKLLKKFNRGVSKGKAGSWKSILLKKTVVTIHKRDLMNFKKFNSNNAHVIDLTDQEDCEKTEMYSCDRCPGVYFDNKEACIQHMRVHSQMDWLSCDVCKIKFSRQEDYLKHRRHHKTKYSCKQCGYSTREALSYNMHMRMYHTNSDKWIRCEMCGTSYYGLFGLKIHEKNKHKEMLSPEYLCSHCGQQFYSSYAFKTHQETDEGRCDLLSMYCVRCGMSFETEELLKEHEIKERKPHDVFTCEVCGEKFSNQKNFKWHRQTHKHKDNGKKKKKLEKKEKNHRLHSDNCTCKVCRRNKVQTSYTCKYCERTFNCTTVLEEHEQTHDVFLW